MSMLESATSWTKQFFMSFGWAGLFLLAFVESSFFPIPPDVLLIPMALASPQSALILAAITTLGSVLGAVFGYFLGQKGGRPVLDWLVEDEHVEMVEAYYERHGSWAVGVAGFSPIPYKVFTVASGMMNMDLKSFTAVSVLSRGARFFLEALIIMMWRESIVAFLKTYFGYVTL
ncbi:MAG: YqaA family protein, partial [Candidatus Nanohaloarchaea archaeon]|nr:YqaA family protein [Candidatus Nanohaloarchaea archaeon]